MSISAVILRNEVTKDLVILMQKVDSNPLRGLGTARAVAGAVPVFSNSLHNKCESCTPKAGKKEKRSFAPLRMTENIKLLSFSGAIVAADAPIQFT